MSGGSDLDDETIGGLFARLVDDGKAFLRAEVNLQVQTVAERIREVRVAIILGVVALLLVLSSLVGILVGCVLGLAKFVGPIAAGVIVTLATLAVAGLLVWVAARIVASAGKARKAAR